MVLPSDSSTANVSALNVTLRAEVFIPFLFNLSSGNSKSVNGYRNPPKSGGKDGLRFLVWRALLRGAEMELLNRHADVGGKKD